MRTDRLQALTDGVFAIALTLLVLDLPQPPEDTPDLAGELLHAWPSYAAYTISFVTVAIVWVNHHRLMDGVALADRTLLELNLLLLLFVSLVPWPTGLLAEHLRTPDQASAAAVTYGLVMTAMSAAFTLVWTWLAHHPRLLHPAAGERVRTSVRRSAVGPVAYAISSLIAIADATVAFVLYALIATYFALSGRRTSPSLDAR